MGLKMPSTEVRIVVQDCDLMVSVTLENNEQAEAWAQRIARKLIDDGELNLRLTGAVAQIEHAS